MFFKIVFFYQPSIGSDFDTNNHPPALRIPESPVDPPPPIPGAGKPDLGLLFGPTPMAHCALCMGTSNFNQGAPCSWMKQSYHIENVIQSLTEFICTVYATGNKYFYCLITEA